MTAPRGGGDGDTEPFPAGGSRPESGQGRAAAAETRPGAGRVAGQHPGDGDRYAIDRTDVVAYDADRGDTGSDAPYDQYRDDEARDDRSRHDEARYERSRDDEARYVAANRDRAEVADEDAPTTALPTGSRRIGGRGRGNAPAIRAAVALLVAVLVLGGLALWGYRQLTGKSTVSPNPCPSGQSLQSAAPLTPALVRLRVTNGTSRSGLAGRTGDALRARHFVVLGVGNAEKPVRGPSVIRYGAGADPQARLLALQLPAARMQAVAGSPGTLELVLGSSFRKLRTPAQVAAAARTARTRGAAPAPTATCR